MGPETGEGGLSSAFERMEGALSGFTGDLSAATREMREMDREAARLSRSLGTSLRSAFDRAVFGGAKLGDVLRDLAGSVVSKTFDAALRPVANGLGGLINGAAGALGSRIGSAFGFANGGAFSSGRVRAFAEGGVVGGPTMFPMRGGLGLMGEAGPEAILPLSRGADGRLGVRSSGGGSAPTVIVNIRTPDIQGFERSRGQVAAELARAVRRGSARL